jgi:hypothetical protein
MISRKRINLGIPLRNGGSDLTMLFLAMKLVASVPDATSQDDRLYVVSKQFAASLELRGTISLPFLQALTLVALYEYSHAIYPAAWMTVGACSRYAEILGLPSARDPYNTLGPCVGCPPPFCITRPVTIFQGLRMPLANSASDQLGRGGREAAGVVEHLRSRPGHHSWQQAKISGSRALRCRHLADERRLMGENYFISSLSSAKRT